MFQTSKDDIMLSNVNRTTFIEDNGLYASGSETLKSLEWCLEQLEQLQTNRSVAGLAADKF